MRLTELNPQFVDAGGEGISDKDGNPVPERYGVGISFDCPCGGAQRAYIPFNNPLDRGGLYHDRKDDAWQRTGDTFETLTLTPSIQRADPGGCRWHGFITNGEVT